MSDIYDPAFPGVFTEEEEWDKSLTGYGSMGFVYPYHNLELQDGYINSDPMPMAPHVPGRGGGQGSVPATNQRRLAAARPMGLQSPPDTPNLAAENFEKQLGSCAPSLYTTAAPADCYAGTPGAQGLPQLSPEGLCQLGGDTFDGGGMFGPAAPYISQFFLNNAYSAPPGGPSFVPWAASPAPVTRGRLPSPASPMPASAKPRLICGFISATGEKCGSTFKQVKDLARHRRTRHRQKGDPSYRCRCGSECSRKDNHVRHVGKHCSKKWCYDMFVCICGRGCAEKDEHLIHVKDCQHGFGHRGRPCAP